jgi:intracellular multiplication protein IcmB
MINGIASVLDSLLSWLSSVSKEPASAFCELETVDNDRKTLVASDGSLATIIAVQGSSRLVGMTEYGEIVDRLSKTLMSFMKTPGHSLQVYWVRDPDGAREQVRDALSGARSQAKMLNLDVVDMLDEKERELTKWISYEAVYFVLWTHPGVLAPAESKAALSKRDAENKQFAGLNFEDAQSPKAILAALRNRHAAFVSSLHSEMRNVDLVAEEIDAHSALKAVRYSVDPHWTPRSWKPTVPGDKIPVKFPIRVSETSAVWWPPVASQVWPRDALVWDNKFVQIGDRIHAPMYVERPSSSSEPFQRLIERAIDLDRKMPFTVSFMIKGGGLDGMTLKSTISSVMAVANSFNGLIRDSINEMRELSKSTSIVSLQIAFNTWAPVGQDDLLRERASRMAQAMIDWGCEVREVTGDPVEGFTSSALGLSSNSIAVKAAAPLSDAAQIFPVTRPASPWLSGAEIYTSPDGKMMPFQPGSEIQSTWNYLYIGGPGSGKSMTMFKQHLATILAPQGGVNLIPQISILDIGSSSEGIVSVIKNGLPHNLRHLVNHYRLRNTPEFAMNPCDLPLGMEFPPPEQRAALVDLFTMFATPAETGIAYEGTAELAGMIVDEMYKAVANTQTGHPTPYSPGYDLIVDEAVESHNLKLPSKPCWYDVRDALFAAGLTHEAHLAARYGYPTVGDAAQAARSSAVKDVYGKKLTSGEGSETLPEAFSRMIQAATREYKILSQATKFDIGESRITIFDLDEVSKAGGPAGEKQNAIMYALGLYILTKGYTMTEDNLSDIPEAYRAYHYAKVQSNKKELKTICCDEFHRISQKFSPMVRERIKVIAREGRKWRVQLMLGSQTLSHFDDDLIDLATGIFMMDRPDQGLVDQYTKRFGLTPTERYALANQVHGARAGGGTFFVRMKTKSGYYNQLLKNPAGPIELWAGSTTSEDKAIRQLVYSALGPVEGRAALALSYSGGSASKEVAQRKESMIQRGHSILDNEEGDLYDQLARDVIKKYQKKLSDERDEEVEAQVRSSSQRDFEPPH